ncbi:MAG: apolipoprotein N-acyltransferase [Beijerinckiaceae bacterium]|nr:apolipoprotein N-acyltransferase [Beijerinckiaceae bacterium]
MHGIAGTIILASGWRRRLIALSSGAMGALAMAPFDLIPALLVPMTAAVWLLDGCTKTPKKESSVWISLGLPGAAWRAFFIGWWWGFGYFLAGLWWLGAAFLVDAEEFAWALPLGVAGLPAVLAIFSGFGFMMAKLLWTPGSGRIFALAAGLGLAEWLRGHLFTGFPWNVFGMAFGGTLLTAQFASVIGLYGLTVAAILIFAAPAVLGDKQPAKAAARRLPLPITAAALAFVAICAFGALRLLAPAPEPVEGVRLRIMQPNLAQDEKFRPENQVQILAHYLSLSVRGGGKTRSGLEGVTVLVWPESAFPFILSRAPWALQRIGMVLPQDTVLVTGAAREASGAQSGGRQKYLNAIQVVASGGHILDSYDKLHLVPFGEYLPFQPVLDRLGLRQFVHIPGGFEAGAGPRLLVVPGLPAAAPLICYEAIFPGEVIPTWASGERPGVLLNVTNDGWFGTTPGPYQHFAQARLRAIEEGIPLIRAANTGISAVVDPYGRITAALPMGKEGILDSTLPKAIAPPVFARFPLAAAFLLWVFALAFALIARFRGVSANPNGK